MPRRPPLITTLVFDLDDTLYDCYRQRVLAAHRYACQKMLRAWQKHESAPHPSLQRLLRLRLKLFKQERNLETLDQRLCARLNLRGSRARRLARVGRQAYFGYPVRNLRLFSETAPTLRRLHRCGVRIFVLTAGYLHIQRAKTRLLGLERSPSIQKIFYTGLQRGRGKSKYLQRVERIAGSPKHVLVVGDRPDSEIRAARQLGLWAVRRRGGEFAALEPRQPLERPHFTIRRLSQLFRLPFVFGKPSQ